MYKKPIYITRVDTCLASDHIVPYGERIRISSESEDEEMALKLLGAYEEFVESVEATEIDK